MDSAREVCSAEGDAMADPKDERYGQSEKVMPHILPRDSANLYSVVLGELPVLAWWERAAAAAAKV